MKLIVLLPCFASAAAFDAALPARAAEDLCVSNSFVRFSYGLGREGGKIGIG